MKLAIKSESRKPRRASRIREAVIMYIDEMGLREIDHELVVKIVPSIPDHLEGTTTYGQIIYDPFVNRSTVTLVDRWLVYMLDTTFHELTHMKQHLDGRLVSRVSGSYWNGERYDSDMYRVDYSRYWDQPWEQEARAEEDRLTKMFIKKSPVWEAIKDLFT